MAISSPTTPLVSIRIKNASDVDLDEVYVFFPDQPSQAVHYGAIKKGTVSDYRSTARAYRFAHVEVKMGNQMLVLRPIDYVGEEPLPAGRFTYVINVQDERLHIDLRQEE